MASVSPPASQESSYGGTAGAGIVSMKGALVSLPTRVTAQFQRFFDRGLAVRCSLPLGGSWFIHLVVLHGYQGADCNAWQLASW